MVQAVKGHWQLFGLVTKALAAAGCMQGLYAWGNVLCTVVQVCQLRACLTPVEAEAKRFWSAHAVSAYASAGRAFLISGVVSLEDVFHPCDGSFAIHDMDGEQLPQIHRVAVLVARVASCAEKALFWWAYGDDDRAPDKNAWQEEAWLMEAREAHVSAARHCVHMVQHMVLHSAKADARTVLSSAFVSLMKNVSSYLLGAVDVPIMRPDANEYGRMAHQRTGYVNCCREVNRVALHVTDLVLLDDPHSGPVVEKLLAMFVRRWGHSCEETSWAVTPQRMAEVLAAYLARRSFWCDDVLRAVCEMGPFPIFGQTVTKVITKRDGLGFYEEELKFWWCSAAGDGHADALGALNVWRDIVFAVMVTYVSRVAQKVVELCHSTEAHEYEFLQQYWDDPDEEGYDARMQSEALFSVRGRWEALQTDACVFVDVTGRAHELQAALRNQIASEPRRESLARLLGAPVKFDTFCAQYDRWTCLRRAWVSAVYRAVVIGRAVRMAANVAAKRRRRRVKTCV
jgi:hypothetical protein